MPLSLPAIGTLVAFTVVWRWNDYLWPFRSSTTKAGGRCNWRWRIPSAALGSTGRSCWRSRSLSVLPMLVIFTALQKTLMSGMTAGAAKE